MNKVKQALSLAIVLAIAGLNFNITAQRSYRSNRLTGTYRLDTRKSDNVRDVVYRATRSLPRDDRDRISQGLIARLEAPDMLSIDKQGRNVTIASSKGNRITFDADGLSQDRKSVV